MKDVRVHILAGDCENKVSGPFWSVLNFTRSLIDLEYKVQLSATYKSKISSEYLELQLNKKYFKKRLFTNGILSTIYFGNSIRSTDIVVSPFLFNLSLVQVKISHLFHRYPLKFIVSVRGETYDLNYWKILYCRFLLSILGNNLTLHFLSQEEFNLFKSSLKREFKYVIVGNGLSEFPPFDSDSMRCNNFATFSRIHPDKGIEKAVKLYGNELIVYGGARTKNEKAYLKHLFSLNVGFKFAGPVNSENKYRVLKGIKNVLFFTKREGFPMLLLDSLICGCRLITTIEANVPDDLKQYVLIVDHKIELEELEQKIETHIWKEKEAYEYVIKNYVAKNQVNKIIKKCLL